MFAFPTGEQVASRVKALNGQGYVPVVVTQPMLVKVLRSGLESEDEFGYQELQRGCLGPSEIVRASEETRVQRGAEPGVGSCWDTNRDYDEE